MATGLIVNVGADTTEFKEEIRQLPKEFEKAEQEITQSADRVGGAIDGALKGLLSAGTVVALERVINHFDKVADAASKYGETAEDIQRVGTAAELTGGNIDSVAMAMERAGVAAAKAARGNEEFVEKFNRAGIDAAAFSTATLTERVEMVARAQQEAGTSGDRHAAILEALGDSVAGIDFQRIADEMGNVVVASNETVTQLSRANDIIHQAKSTAMVFAAEGLGAIADYFEKIGSILGQGDSGVLGRLAAFNKIAMQLTPFKPLADLFGFSGQTIKQMEEEEKRLNAIALLRSREGIENATEEQIKAEMDAIAQRERAATNATNDTNQAIDEGKAKTEQNAKIKQRLLEISLSLKEAEAAGNSELAKHLRYQEDLYKGILKYKDAEDAYGMAVREANAELAKRNQLLGKAATGPNQEAVSQANQQMRELRDRQSQELVGTLGASSETEKNNRQAEINESYKRQMELLQGQINNLMRPDNFVLPQSIPTPSASSFLPQQAQEPAPQERMENKAQIDPATETTLQKAVAFLQELTGKLPQPVLV